MACTTTNVCAFLVFGELSPCLLLPLLLASHSSSSNAARTTHEIVKGSYLSHSMCAQAFSKELE